MVTTILDEAINGWVVTVYKDGKKELYTYERLVDARRHLDSVYDAYSLNRLKEVQNASV